MADSIYKWSLTASENDQADSLVNWRENQLPDTVNDSGRSMMMRIAELREDLTGALVTAGTQPAYTVTTKAAFDTLANGRLISVRIHATNAAGAATLNVNGLGAKSIRKFGTTGDLAVGVGDLQLGNLYQFMYASTANAGAGGWIIPNPSLATGGGFATATAMLFMQAAAPVGWTKQTTHDNKALRIVSGTGGASGGTTAFTTVFASRTPAGDNTATALTIAMLAAHTHTQQGAFTSGYISADHSHAETGTHLSGGRTAAHNHSHAGGATQSTSGGNRPSGSGGTSVDYTAAETQEHQHYTAIGGQTGGVSANHTHATTISGATTSVGSGATHDHAFTGTAMDFSVQYVDAIICTKD